MTGRSLRYTSLHISQQIFAGVVGNVSLSDMCVDLGVEKLVDTLDVVVNDHSSIRYDCHICFVDYSTLLVPYVKGILT